MLLIVESRSSQEYKFQLEVVFSEGIEKDWENVLGRLFPKNLITRDSTKPFAIEYNLY